MPENSDKRPTTSVRISVELMEEVEAEIKRHPRPRPSRGDLIEEAWRIAHPPAAPIANPGDPAVTKADNIAPESVEAPILEGDTPPVQSPHAEDTPGDSGGENPRIRALEEAVARLAADFERFREAGGGAGSGKQKGRAGDRGSAGGRGGG